MFIKALIAARSGSVRVKNKNIRPFARSTLLELKIEQLKRLNVFDDIIVNSNDDEILDIAKKHDVTIIRRNPYYASNSVSMSEVYKNMAENIGKCDTIAYVNCTNPLIKDQTIVDILNFYKEHINEYDSVNSAHYIKEFLFLDNKPINYDLKNQPRSQDLPDILALNFAVSVLSKKKMIEYKNVVGEKPFIYPIEEIEATDIDNQIDFDFAEFLYYNKQMILNTDRGGVRHNSFSNKRRYAVAYEVAA